MTDFYSPAPLTSEVGVVPELFAAEDLTDRLVRTLGGGEVVLPRAAMQRAEAELGWRQWEVLCFARLRELARLVNADQLVVGRISRFELTPLGGGGKTGGGGALLLEGLTEISIQLFDVAQGRMIAEVRESAFVIGLLRPRVAERVLRMALERALPSLRSALSQ